MTKEHWVIIFLTLGIAWADALLPRGMNLAVLYIPLIVLCGGFFKSAVFLVAYTTFAALLAWVDVLISPAGSGVLYSVANRAFLLLAIATSLLLMLRLDSARKQFAALDVVLSENLLLEGADLMTREIRKIPRLVLVLAPLSFSGVALLLYRGDLLGLTSPTALTIQQAMGETILDDLFSTHLVLVYGLGAFLVLSIVSRIVFSVARLILLKEPLLPQALRLLVWSAVNLSIYCIFITFMVLFSNMVRVVSDEVALLLQVGAFATCMIIEANSLGRHLLRSDRRMRLLLRTFSRGASAAREMLKGEVKSALDDLTGEGDPPEKEGSSQ